MMEPRDNSLNAVDPPPPFTSLSSIAAPFNPYNTTFGDDTFTGNLALDDDGPIFPPDWDQDTPPNYDDGEQGHLYSTPLNWDAPVETKIEPAAAAPAYAMNSVLSEAQQEKLRKIAMPSHLQYRGQHSPNSTTSNKSHSISSPDNHDREERNRKRKSSAEADDDDDDDSNPPVKKTAHNMIEKRYRTNLNDKIAALRDSVPSLRQMSKPRDGADEPEDLQGLTPAHKSNKATVLAKATEYIHHLEKRNKRLLDENSEQKSRLAAFETLFRSGSMGYQVPPMGNPFQFGSAYNTPGPSPDALEPQGMIQVPDDMRRLHGHMNQQAFSVPQEQYQPARQMVQGGWQNSPYFGKLMVGSLAGLMLFEGMREAEQAEDSPNARGLFALPIHLLRGLSSIVHSALEVHIAGYHVPATTTMMYMKIFLVLGALLYAFLPSFFETKPKPADGKTRSPALAAAPSLASPIQVRRQAWLTAVQTVWVPRHQFILEVAALCLKMLKLSVRNIIGTQGYAYLTGVTEQQEAARVKAWTIALDAQLAGGDIEVNISRLTLTLLASHTLPDTPARLMLKALHIRVLLWEVGNTFFSGSHTFRAFAAHLARWKWNEAKHMQMLMNSGKMYQDEQLPSHLVALLEQECDDVLVDIIGQRAYNLAWNLPTAQNATSNCDGMDGVVDDHAIHSPLDAVAAWYSSLVLQRGLVKTLVGEEAEDKKPAIDSVSLAVATAPVGSVVQVRALVAYSVLAKEKRGKHIATAMKSLSPLNNKKIRTESTFINRSTLTAGLSDVKMSLHCAMAIAHMERFPVPSNPQGAHSLINNIRPIGMTLLGFASIFTLIQSMEDHVLVSTTCRRSFEDLAGSLRIWLGGKDGEKSCLDTKIKYALVQRCLNIKKRIIGMEDPGYESMGEDAGEGC